MTMREAHVCVGCFCIGFLGLLLLEDEPAHAKPKPTTQGWSGEGVVVHVVDGDTLDVAITMIIRIRLEDCWAPETRGSEKERGLISKQGLLDLVDHKKVTFEVPVTTKLKDSFTFGRAVGRVWVGEVDVSERMVELGLATKEKRKVK